jgi:peptidoglycan/LPS O-acetylase OafA/YrhL
MSYDVAPVQPCDRQKARMQSPQMPSSTGTAFEDFQARRHFGSLDGLRALCIVAVLWHHSPLCPQLSGAHVLLTRGFLGVDLFFVLSGFLITTLLLREREATGTFSLPDFYWRRACRILPPYLLTVGIVAGIYIGVKGQTQYLEILPYYLLFLSNFLTYHMPILLPTWSLSVEEQYYLVWPVLLLLTPRRWVMPVLLAAIAANVLLALGSLDEPAPAAGDGPLLFRLPNSTYAPILMGSLTALWLHERRAFGIAWRLLGHRLAAPACFGLLLALLVVLPTNVIGWPNLALHATMCLCLASVVVREGHGLAPLLAWRPAARLGEISYGLYLYHLFGLHIANAVAKAAGTTDPWLVSIAYVLLAVLISEVSFRTIERRALALKSRRPRLGRTPAAAPAKARPD